MLTTGQIVLYNNRPYRVQHVNACRAFIVPLKKPRKNTGRPRGTSIGADSLVPVLSEAEAESYLTAGPAGDTNPPVPIRSKLRLPGWVAKDAPDYRAGSLNERVLTYILLHPRSRTPDLLAALKLTAGNVRACLTRLQRAGVIDKE